MKADWKMGAALLLILFPFLLWGLSQAIIYAAPYALSGVEQFWWAENKLYADVVWITGENLPVHSYDIRTVGTYYLSPDVNGYVFQGQQAESLLQHGFARIETWEPDRHVDIVYYVYANNLKASGTGQQMYECALQTVYDGGHVFFLQQPLRYSLAECGGDGQLVGAELQWVADITMKQETSLGLPTFASFHLAILVALGYCAFRIRPSWKGIRRRASGFVGNTPLEREKT